MSSIYRKYFSPPRNEVLQKSRYGKKQIKRAQRMRSNDIYRASQATSVTLPHFETKAQNYGTLEKYSKAAISKSNRRSEMKRKDEKIKNWLKS